MSNKSKSRRLSPVIRHLLVASLYLAFTLLLWWPLPQQIMTHVPGSETWAFDEYTFVWNLWWFRHALLDLGVNPMHSDYIFYPLGIDLYVYTYNLLNAMIALPLLDWLGVVLTSNLILIGMTVLSGWGTWLLVRWLLIRSQKPLGGATEAAAFGAGCLYAFAAYRAVYAALGHYNLVSTGFIPLFTLFFLKSFWGHSLPRRESRHLSEREGEGAMGQEGEWAMVIPSPPSSPPRVYRPSSSYWTPALLTGIFMAAAMLNEMSLGVFLVMLALLLMVLTWQQRRWGWIMRLIVAVIIATMLWAPVGFSIVRQLISPDYALQGWGDALKLSADLLSFTSPTALHPYWGPTWVNELRNVQVNALSPGTSRFSDVNTVFVGVVVLILCALAIFRFRREVRAWAIGLILFMIFSLGPVLQIGGRYLFTFDHLLPNGQETAIPLPFVLLHYLPIINGNRASNRFSVVLMLCAAVLVGYTLWWIAELITKRSQNSYIGAAFAMLLTGLLLFEHLALPLPLTDARIPEGYQIIKQDPDDIAILTLPLGWRNSFGVVGVENTRNQWYMAGHGKRLIQGNISRAPTEKFNYWQKLPVLRSLIEIQNDHDISESQKAADTKQALETMSLLGVRYVAVHPAIKGRPPYSDNRERALNYLQEVLPLKKLYDGKDLLLFAIDSPPSEGSAASNQIEFGNPQSELYRVSGWHSDEIEGAIDYNWAKQSATFLLPATNHKKPIEVTIHLRPFQLPQTMQPLINQNTVGEPIILEAGWNEYTFTIPPALLDGATTPITLNFSRRDLPIDVLPGVAQIGQTGVELRHSITVKSGGPGIGDLAWITVNGKEASDHRNGTNVTVIEPSTGTIEAIRGFDTTANEFERDRLHQFIANIADGKVVIIALKGAATTFLNLETVAAFKTLGATTGPTDHAVSYALIGVKGATEGSALEKESKTESVDLLFLPDDRPLSTAVDWVRWKD